MCRYIIRQGGSIGAIAIRHDGNVVIVKTNGIWKSNDGRVPYIDSCDDHTRNNWMKLMSSIPPAYNVRDDASQDGRLHL